MERDFFYQGMQWQDKGELFYIERGETDFNFI